MPTSDHDIQRLAHLFIQLDGEQAIAKAREMVEQMRSKGDNEGADTWPRIIVAIGELGPMGSYRFWMIMAEINGVIRLKTSVHLFGKNSAIA
jgi:hypothetical protein